MTTNDLPIADEINAHCLRGVNADDRLVLRMPRRMVTQYATDENGSKILNLFYGDKEISFDEAELFVFGETLGKQNIFRAGDAQNWGQNNWAQISDCLNILLDQGILEFHTEDDDVEVSNDRSRSSPLPLAKSNLARTWQDCEAITTELTGRAVEIGFLELVIPMFRVVHIYLDGDNRQVGEANVFPQSLRLDRQTEWMTCTYSGTRHMVDRPMNASALKGMLAHWPQMMLALQQIRASYFERFPDAKEGWTVGRVERLAALVLAVVTLPMIRHKDPVANGDLHPALSSLFRVTDGLRMAMHQMLFVPIGEPTRAADAPVTIDEILDYTERNYSFHSGTGVCAGPKHMVREFLSVLIDGARPEKFNTVIAVPAVASALAHIDEAFDYGLLGLRAHAALFSFWPAMTRCYEDMAAIAERAVAAGQQSFIDLDVRTREILTKLKQATYLGSEKWRMNREQVYADMFDTCGRGLGQSGLALLDRLQLAHKDNVTVVADDIGQILMEQLGTSSDEDSIVAELAKCLAQFALITQSILDVACCVQSELNDRIARPQPIGDFTAADINNHNLLQGNAPQRLPFLLDEIENLLGLRLTINRHEISVRAMPRPQHEFQWFTNSAGAVPAEQRAIAQIKEYTL